MPKFSIDMIYKRIGTAKSCSNNRFQWYNIRYALGFDAMIIIFYLINDFQKITIGVKMKKLTSCKEES